MDDQPSDVTAGAGGGPASAERGGTVPDTAGASEDGPDAATDAAGLATVAAPRHPDAHEAPSADADLPETRAARRARREASTLKAPVLPALATVRRPVAAAATVVLAALLVLAVLADPVVLAAGLAWAGIVVAWGWPALHGSSSRFGSSLAIGVPAVLAPAVAAIPSGEPYLRLRADRARHRARDHVRAPDRAARRPSPAHRVGAVTSFGLAVIALGTTWMPLSRNHRATEVAVVGFVAIAVSAFADLGAGLDKVRPWMLPIAMLLGGGGALVAAAVLEAPDSGPAALIGFLCAAVAHSTRRMLSVLPAITSARAQLSSAAASLLVPGVVAYGLALAIVG